MAKNVYGKPLERCTRKNSKKPTGFYRDGYCRTGPDDTGVHTVCASMTPDFLKYTRQQGNDLSSPSGSFPGLTEGDRWCLCAGRYLEAKQAGRAPAAHWDATNQASLKYPGFTMENFQDTPNGRTYPQNSERKRRVTKVKCGNPARPVTTKNRMTAKVILARFFTATAEYDYETQYALLSQTNLNILHTVAQLPRKQPSQITPVRSLSCRAEFIVSYANQSTWYVTLERQMEPQPGTPDGRFQVTADSGYWRITDLAKI